MTRLLAVLIILAAGPVGAEQGTTLTFGGRPGSPRISILPSHKRGDVLWLSPDSDPLPRAAQYILFQGDSSHPGFSFEASVNDGTGWTPWSAAKIERVPNGRFWGRVPISVSAGAVVRLRVVHESMPPYGMIEIYSLEAMSLRAEALHLPEFAVAPSSDVPKPAVIDRKAWGAAPPKEEYTPMIPVRITVHHTVGAQPLDLEDGLQEMILIQRFHQQGRGWNDIGYHFLIDGAGRIYQGRPETMYGAHVRSLNKGNVGISLMGRFHEPRSQNPTPAQFDSLVALSRWLTRAYGIDPATIAGHRDLGRTACPGDTLYPRLPDLRRALGEASKIALFLAPRPEFINGRARLARDLDRLAALALSASKLFEGRR